MVDGGVIGTAAPTHIAPSVDVRVFRMPSTTIVTTYSSIHNWIITFPRAVVSYVAMEIVRIPRTAIVGVVLWLIQN